MYIRAKLIAMFLGAVLALVVAVQFALLRPLHSELEEGAHAAVESAAAVVAVIERADSASLRGLAESLANREDIVDGMARTCQPEEDSGECASFRHDTVRDALEVWLRSYQAVVERNRARGIGTRDIDGIAGSLPALIIVTDATGTVVARAIGDTSDWWGESVPNLAGLPIIAEALANGTAHAASDWTEGVDTDAAGTLMLLSAAPVTLPGQEGAGRALGAVLVGMPLNDQVARDRQAVLGGVDIAYAVGGEIRGSGFRPEDLRALQQASYESVHGGETLDFATYAGSSATTGSLVRASHGDATYIVSRGRFAGDGAGDEGVDYLVAANVTDAVAEGRKAAFLLPALALILGLLGILGIVLAVRGFVAPIADLDAGLQQVIAGNRDFVWKTDTPNGFTNEMGRSLNVMSAFLQGKPLPDEDEPEDDSDWVALLEFADVNTSAGRAAVAVPPAETTTLGKSPSGRHETVNMSYRRIFDEYVAARRRVDPDGAPVTYDRFVGQLKRNAAAYKKKHDCDEVRFEVVVRDSKVLLKPVPVAPGSPSS